MITVAILILIAQPPPDLLGPVIPETVLARWASGDRYREFLGSIEIRLLTDLGAREWWVRDEAACQILARADRERLIGWGLISDDPEIRYRARVLGFSGLDDQSWRVTQPAMGRPVSPEEGYRVIGWGLISTDARVRART